MPHALSALLASTLLWSLACTGTIEAPRTEQTEPPGPVPETCDDPSPPPVLRRLTREEWTRSVADALDREPGEVATFAGALLADDATGGFASNAATDLGVRALELLVEASEALAERMADEGALDCVAGRANCTGAWLDAHASRLWRRPLDAGTRARWVAQDAAWVEAHGARDAAVMTIASALLSPSFLYITEVGTNDGEGRRVTELELATRLSMTLWGTGPDETLLLHAESGALDLEAEVDRMLADPRAEFGVRSMLGQWLSLRDLGAQPRDPALFPEWNPQIAASMTEEAERFVDEVADQGIGALFGSPVAFVDAHLAPLYGVAGPAEGEPMRRVDALPGRAGVLTLPAWLASNAHATESSWVRRGHFIRTHILCQSLPEPPADIDFDSVPREERVEHPVCGSCHAAMDPLGWGFDGYDALGLPRAEPRSGELRDAHGELGELAGTFDDVAELSARLAESPVVEACMVRQAFRYAHRRYERADEACAIEDVGDAFAETDGSFRALLRSVVLDPSFARLEDES